MIINPDFAKNMKIKIIVDQPHLLSIIKDSFATIFQDLKILMVVKKLEQMVAHMKMI